MKPNDRTAIAVNRTQADTSGTLSDLSAIVKNFYHTGALARTMAAIGAVAAVALWVAIFAGNSAAITACALLAAAGLAGALLLDPKSSKGGAL